MKKFKIKTKEELLKHSNDAYNAFLDIINSLPAKSKYYDILPNHRDKNIRDLCAQIIGWQNYLLSWYNEGMKDRLPDIPAKGYTWKIADALEMKIWQRFQKTSLDDCLAYLGATQSEVIENLEKHTDQELFEKKHYRWTLNKSMAFYFIQFAYHIFVDKINIIKKCAKNQKIEFIVLEDTQSDNSDNNISQLEADDSLVRIEELTDINEKQELPSTEDNSEENDLKEEIKEDAHEEV